MIHTVSLSPSATWLVSTNFVIPPRLTSVTLLGGFAMWVCGMLGWLVVFPISHYSVYMQAQYCRLASPGNLN